MPGWFLGPIHRVRVAFLCHRAYDIFNFVGGGRSLDHHRVFTYRGKPSSSRRHEACRSSVGGISQPRPRPDPAQTKKTPRTLPTRGGLKLKFVTSYFIIRKCEVHWWGPRTSNPVCRLLKAVGGFDSHALPPRVSGLFAFFSSSLSYLKIAKCSHNVPIAFPGADQIAAFLQVPGGEVAVAHRGPDGGMTQYQDALIQVISVLSG
jgi:hypothetical protein